MNDFRYILRFLGLLLLAEGARMLLCLSASLYFRDGAWLPILLSGAISLSSGLLLFLANFRCRRLEKKRLAYLLVSLMWIVLGLFGSLPFLLSHSVASFFDALFESLSGLTATGATALPDIESLPQSVLLWRSLSQWIGGFGIILLVLAIAPRLGINKYSLYTAEASGADNSSKSSIRMSTTIRRMLVIYLSLSAAFFLLLCLSGLSPWASLNLVFTNISSGGFSIYNDGIARLSHSQQLLIAAAMWFSGISFAMLYDLFTFKISRIRHKLDQFGFYASVTLFAILTISLYLRLRLNLSTSDSLRLGIIQATSAITTSGTMAADVTLWSPLANYVFMILALCGAMAGSTSGGLKAMRVLILLRNVRMHLIQRLHPNSTNPIRLNGHPVSPSISTNVMVIFFIYVFTLLLGSSLLITFGETPTESIGAAVGCLSGYGPGLASTGGFGSYAAFSPASKALCSLLMILGRLECLTVLILLTRKFWHR